MSWDNVGLIGMVLGVGGMLATLAMGAYAALFGEPRWIRWAFPASAYAMLVGILLMLFSQPFAP